MLSLQATNPAQYQDEYLGVPEKCIRSEFCAKKYYSEYGKEEVLNGETYQAKCGASQLALGFGAMVVISYNLM